MILLRRFNWSFCSEDAFFRASPQLVNVFLPLSDSSWSWQRCIFVLKAVRMLADIIELALSVIIRHLFAHMVTILSQDIELIIRVVIFNQDLELQRFLMIHLTLGWQTRLWTRVFRVYLRRLINCKWSLCRLRGHILLLIWTKSHQVCFTSIDPVDRIPVLPCLVTYHTRTVLKDHIEGLIGRRNDWTEHTWPTYGICVNVLCLNERDI